MTCFSNEPVDPAAILCLKTDIETNYERMSKLRQMVSAQILHPPFGAVLFPPPAHRAPRDAICVQLAHFDAEEQRAASCALAVNNDGNRSDAYQTLVLECSAALVRRTDRLILDALDIAAHFALSGNVGLTAGKIQAAFDQLERQGVPDDGERFAVVGWQQWEELGKIEEFANADFLTDEQLPWTYVQGKRWRNTTWIPKSGLAAWQNVRHCFLFHRSAIGHAIDPSVSVSVRQIAETDEIRVTPGLSQAAHLIDPLGLVGLNCSE
jgi:hypothetical protein